MRRKFYTIFILASLSVTALAQDYVFNRHPLAPTEFAELPIGTIKAQGWLYDQLVRQKNGMTGHLDELYSEVVGAPIAVFSILSS